MVKRNVGSRVLYKNVKNVKERKNAMARLRKAGLNPAFTDGGVFSKSKKGTDVYAMARKKSLKGFKTKREKLAYI
jgi:hypothetical protein